MSQSFSSSPRTSSLSNKVRVLIAGPELIAASLNTLLAREQDMEVRTPLPDIREVLDVAVTNASFATFVSAIRLLARRKEETYFPPPPEPPPSSFDAADLNVSHRLVFYRERLDACASSIQWELTEKEVTLIRQFGEQTAELAEEMKHSSSRGRYALSQRIYPFLSSLAGKTINSRFLAFQVLLEYGILQYLRC